MQHVEAPRPNSSSRSEGLMTHTTYDVSAAGLDPSNTMVSHLSKSCNSFDLVHLVTSFLTVHKINVKKPITLLEGKLYLHRRTFQSKFLLAVVMHEQNSRMTNSTTYQGLANGNGKSRRTAQFDHAYDCM